MLTDAKIIRDPRYESRGENTFLRNIFNSMHCGSALKRKGDTEVRFQDLPEGTARDIPEYQVTTPGYLRFIIRSVPRHLRARDPGQAVRTRRLCEGQHRPVTPGRLLQGGTQGDDACPRETVIMWQWRILHLPLKVLRLNNTF